IHGLKHAVPCTRDKLLRLRWRDFQRPDRFSPEPCQLPGVSSVLTAEDPSTHSRRLVPNRREHAVRISRVKHQPRHHRVQPASNPTAKFPRLRAVLTYKNVAV